MKQEIRFRGLSLAGDDQSAQPGELSLCAGVELRDGSLRPSVLSGSSIGGGAKMKGYLLYVHKTASYTHYITASDDTPLQMYFYTESGGSLTEEVFVTYTEFDYDDIRAIESIGNTVIILTNTGLHYFLFKTTTGKYKYLGNRIPFVRLQFRPSTNYKGAYDRSTVDNDDPSPTTEEAWRAMTFDVGDACSASNSARVVSIKADKQADVTDAVWALINQTNDTIAKDGHFYAPFMVRYCYRLYDGSMVMHSAPVFMNVSLPLCYKVYAVNVSSKVGGGSSDLFYVSDKGIKVYDGSGSYEFRVTRFTAFYVPNNVSIMFRDAKSSILKKLKDDWGDIVKSIDIFITPPITREDSSQKIQRMVIEDNQYGVRNSMLTAWGGTRYMGDGTYRNNVIFDIPMLSDDAYIQKIRDTATFFKIKSLNLDDSIPTAWSELDHDKSIVPYITTQEQMTDDYKTHNLLRPAGSSNVASGLYAYNHRLNVFGMRELLFEGFNIEDMVNYCSDNGGYSAYASVYKVMVELDTDDGKKYVETLYNSAVSVPEYVICNSCLFYPDARAVRMVIYYRNSYGSELAKSMKMEPCNMLNGSMTVTPFLDRFIISNDYAGVHTYSVDNYAPLLNKIYTSEVNNPYYFPVEGINTVGVGSIVGIAATTRALSQGQFGQFPLMAFCTDGIWALDVSSTGTYSSIHPISREVCVNPDSICQLDQSVLFATDRALSRVVESTVASCSDALDGPIFRAADLLPRLADTFAADTGDEEEHPDYYAAYDDPSIAKLLAFSIPPIDYFKRGRILYDFTNARVLVLPASPSKSASFPVYVFSVRDQSWSTMLLPPLMAAVNAYPYPYVQLADGSLLTLDRPYDYTDAEIYPGIVLTRPLSFADTMQALQAFSHHHDCQEPPLLFIYGSNDIRSWHYIGRSRRSHAPYLPAHSFRYFRLALYLQMRTPERYSSILLDIIEKYRKL